MHSFCLGTLGGVNFYRHYPALYFLTISSIKNQRYGKVFNFNGRQDSTTNSR